jgi:hypothetical protein
VLLFFFWEFPLTIAQDIQIQGVNLKGFTGCSSQQKKRIIQGWEVAKDFAEDLGDIDNLDFNEAAALEFLGPPGLIGGYKDNVIGILKQVKSFGQGSGAVPTPFKRAVYIRCDDWQHGCLRNGPNAMAYTENRIQNQPDGRKPANDGEKKTATPVINFCPNFFNQDSWTDKVNENKNAGNSIKLNLEWWKGNTGKITCSGLRPPVKN